MKKVLLSFSLLLSCSANINDLLDKNADSTKLSPTEIIINYSIDKLYTRQRGIIKDLNKYKTLIKPFLEEAGKDLELINFLIKNTESTYHLNYINSLVDLAAAEFNYLVKSNSFEAKSNFNSACKKFTRLLKEIAKKESLSFDVKEEIKKTLNILSKANKAYYKKISIFKKTGMFFTNLDF